MVLHQALIILMDKSYLIDITGMNGYICEPKIENKKAKFLKKIISRGGAIGSSSGS
jgi:hypothetical protein